MVPQAPTPGNDPSPLSVAVAIGPASAHVSPALAAPLRALLAHDVAAWTEHGFVVCKRTTVRTVLRGELDGTGVHVKVFRADGFTDHARDLLRGRPGRREAEHLLRARALGLPAVEPIAHGMARCGDGVCSFVATRSTAGAPFAFDLPRAVHARVGALLRRAHDLGLQPGDLHPDNLLVETDGTVRLVDLTSLRHGGEPGLQNRARALAFCCQTLDGGALDRRAADLLRGYLDAGPPLPATLRRDLRLATHRWRAAALPAFGRRAFRSNRLTEVEPRRRGAAQWHWHLGPGGADAPYRSLCAAFAAAPPRPDKSGRRGAVWLRESLVVKDRPAAAARKLWRAAYWLQFARVAVPAPVALRLFAGRGLMFTQRIGGSSLAAELAAGSLTGAAVLAAARSLGTEVGRLHAHGLGNRDLKFDNLVRDPGTGRIAMVDLDGVRRRPAIDTRGRGADLGRLLAAWRGAGAPAGAAAVGAFLRAWLRAHQCLLQAPPARRILRVAAQRAGEWAAAHR